MTTLFLPVVKNILFKRVRWRALVLFFSLVTAVLGLLAAYYQKTFIDLLGHGTESGQEHQFLVLVLAFLCFLISSFLTQLNLYWAYRESLISQRELAKELYEQALHLKSESLDKRTVGEIVALYATDVPAATILLEQTLPFGASTFFPILLTPFALTAIIGSPLYETFLLVVLVALINTALAFRQSGYFFLFKQLAAARTSLVNEWLQNIRTLKILNWIKAFEARIFEVRERETINRIRMVTNGQVMNAITSHATFVFNIAAGATLIYFHKRTLSAGEIWAVFWVMGLFLNRPLRQLPWFFTFAFDALTSARRLQSFLNLRSFHDYQIHNRNETDSNDLLEIEDLNWSHHHGPVLKNLNLKVREGEKIAILGEVGSGKTALLLCLMGELKAHFKKFNHLGKPVMGAQALRLKRMMNYVPQESFLMNSTLRDNISFEYEKPSFQDNELQNHLYSVDFNPDYEGLSDGLNTPIGERGVNLSGGQKQRLSLARSLAQKKNLVLMDDSMSQLDAKTEYKILKDLFSGVLKDKTVILTTHRKTALQFVDSVYEMHDGELKKWSPHSEGPIS